MRALRLKSVVFRLSGQLFRPESSKRRLLLEKTAFVFMKSVIRCSRRGFRCSQSIIRLNDYKKPHLVLIGRLVFLEASIVVERATLGLLEACLVQAGVAPGRSSAALVGPDEAFADDVVSSHSLEPEGRGLMSRETSNLWQRVRRHPVRASGEPGIGVEAHALSGDSAARSVSLGKRHVRDATLRGDRRAGHLGPP
jgi:hypothetical protein